MTSESESTKKAKRYFDFPSKYLIFKRVTVKSTETKELFNS